MTGTIPAVPAASSIGKPVSQMGEHTPGPWIRSKHGGLTIYENVDRSLSKHVIAVVRRSSADAALIAAAPDLLQSSVLLEAAEHAHANCDECDGEGVPELCAKCFPLFDDARIARRAAIAKATGATP